MLKKHEMYEKHKILQVMIEKEILCQANSKWIVDLKYSFQDDFFLYFVMEYLPGGDLSNLMSTRSPLSEQESRFYCAELVLAIEAIHQLNSIHRDIKPNNILIGKDGHIKLVDFGLSIKKYSPNNDSLNKIKKRTRSDSLSNVELKNRCTLAYSIVGTPDYIAYEVFTKKGYGPQIDWWSLGVILYEMMFGYTPFQSEIPSEKYIKILNWKTHFKIPENPNLSKEARDFLKKLITDADIRLGINGASEIKRHPFFKGIDWNNLNIITPPFIPNILNNWDTKYFHIINEEEPYNQCKLDTKINKHFFNFSYKKNENRKDNYKRAMELLDKKISAKIEQNENSKSQEIHNNEEIIIRKRAKTENYFNVPNVKGVLCKLNLSPSPIKISNSKKKLISQNINSNSHKKDLYSNINKKLNFQNSLLNLTTINNCSYLDRHSQEGSLNNCKLDFLINKNTIDLQEPDLLFEQEINIKRKFNNHLGVSPELKNELIYSPKQNITLLSDKNKINNEYTCFLPDKSFDDNITLNFLSKEKANAKPSNIKKKSTSRNPLIASKKEVSNITLQNFIKFNNPFQNNISYFGKFSNLISHKTENNIFKFEKNNDEEGPFSSKNRRFDPLSFTNKLANMK